MLLSRGILHPRRTRRRPSRSLLTVALALCLGGAATDSVRSEAAGTGLVILASNDAAQAAGLVEGASIVSVVLPAADPTEESLASPLQLAALETRWAPRGGATLVADGGGRWAPPPAPWELRTRPRLTADLVAAHAAADVASRDGDGSSDARAAFAGAIDAAVELPAPERAWLWSEAGRLAARRFAWQEAQDAYRRSAEALGQVDAPWQPSALLVLLLDRADAAIRGTLWDDAGEALAEALAVAPTGGLLEAAVRKRLAWQAREQGRMEDAARESARALELRQDAAPDSFIVAESLLDLAQIEAIRQDPERARELTRRAGEILRSTGDEEGLARVLAMEARADTLANEWDAAIARLDEALVLLERQPRETTHLVGALVNLGLIHFRRGDLDLARPLMDRAHDVLRRIGPDQVGTGIVISNRGTIAWESGDLETAERLWYEAAEHYARTAPDSPSRAEVLVNVARATKARGDFVGAESVLREAIDIYRRTTPTAETIALAHNNLGAIRKELGDLDGAEREYRQALEMYRRIVPEGGLGEARVLVNLGQVARARGRFDDAESLLDRALTIRERDAPGSVEVAITLANLGSLAEDRGDLDGALALQRRAFEIREARSPGGLEVAIGHHALGKLALARGDLDAAETHLRDALAIRRRWAPGTIREVETWHDLGRVQRRAGDRSGAETSLCRAVELLDALLPRAGSIEEDRQFFRATFADVYRDCVDARVSVGDEERAFALLERSRARSFLLQLSERDPGFSSDVPEDVVAALRRNRTRSGQLLDELADRGADAGEEAVRSVADELDVLRREREVLRLRIRDLAPREATLRTPDTVDWRQAAEALDPGTALIAYSVGDERTLAFVVARTASGPSLHVHAVDVDRAILSARILELRAAIARAIPGDPELERLARELHQLLVDPARGSLASAQRLLISPDGPLHGLPFGALRSAGEDGHWLIEDWPLHFVLSATVYRSLRAEAMPSSTHLLAFGDPRPGGAHDGAAAARALLGLAGTPEPLPWAREEALAIGELFPPGEGRVFVGDEATEDRVKRMAAGAGVLHFATHGLLSERLPMNSALQLTPSPGAPGSGAGENGLLEAWEIIDQLRLDARLVTLSACESALGRDLGGEGLISLTRAFQFAGARTVLASIWRVADQATAALMTSTYRALVAGDAPLDEALRAGQLALIGSAGSDLGAAAGEEPATDRTRAVGGLAPSRPDWSHPFFWAGFQLYGDR